MIQRILVPTDFSPVSRAAEDRALELARPLGARVWLHHAVERVDDGESDAELSGFYRSLEERAARELEATAGRFRTAEVPCEVEVNLGRRWRSILEKAEREEVDLIVMGSRQTLAGERPQLGTTSHQVFFASVRPVMFVRIQGT